MADITVKKAISLFKAIDELKASKPKLSFEVWYNLSKVQSSLRPAIETYELKYNEVLDSCSKKENGKPKMLSIDPPMIEIKFPEKFAKEVKDLNNKMVPVKIEKIEKKEFKGVKIEGSDNMFTLFDHVIK